MRALAGGSGGAGACVLTYTGGAVTPETGTTAALEGAVIVITVGVDVTHT